MAIKKAKSKKTLKDLKKLLPLQSSPTVEAKPAPLPDRESEDEPLSFEEEMERLGVVPEREPDETVIDSDGEAAVPDENAEICSSEKLSDGELFLSALKNIEIIFPSEDSLDLPAASIPKRLKKIRKKRFIPERQIDLHGLTRQEALRKVHFFIENAAYEGLKMVLIITGRGHGSEGEAVLRTAVEEFLAKETQSRVFSYGRAPRNMGGEGAIAVILRTQGG